MKNILLIGNPNVGKTALLNRLTGSTYSIGNWAGVTVTRQEGILKTDKESFHLLDLPGIYSLIPCSEDEVISVREIFTSNYDLIINIIDMNNLHQNLMLTAELLELGIPMIGVLNFCDEFQKTREINIPDLQDFMNIPMLPISAITGQGVDNLIHMISLTDTYHSWISPKRVISQDSYKNLKDLFPMAEARYNLAGIAPAIDPSIVYTQLAINNPLILKVFSLDSSHTNPIIENNNDTIPNYLDDILTKKELIINITAITIKKGQENKVNIAKKIDKILLHPIFGYISFGVIMSVLFTMVFNAANPWIDFIDWLIGEKFSTYANLALVGTAPEIHSFVVDGLIGGVGGVLTFVPLIFILYIFLACLEESGYLARIAILLEYPFSKIGLSGKSFFPMLLGFGCTVPAIYGTRVLETPAIRRLTAIVSSLVSCGARLPVYALFLAAFFPNNGGLMLLSLYLLGIFLAILLSFIMSRLPMFKSKNTCFVMVVPPYRLPNLKIVLRTASLHASSYIKNAGGVILGMLMVIWVFSYFPNNGNVSESYIAKAGKVIQPIFEPLGFGDRWEPVVSIIPSLIAKEAVVGFFGQVLQNEETEASKETEISPPITIAGELLEIGTTFLGTIKSSLVGMVTWNLSDQFATPSEEELEEEAGTGIVGKLRQIWPDENGAKKAYSFMIFILLTLPCVAAMGALKQELENRYFYFTIALYLLLPYLGSLIFYQLAILF